MLLSFLSSLRSHRVIAHGAFPLMELILFWDSEESGGKGQGSLDHGTRIKSSVAHDKSLEISGALFLFCRMVTIPQSFIGPSCADSHW